MAPKSLVLFLMLVWVFFRSSLLWGCDICSGGQSSTMQGILPIIPKHMAGLRTRYQYVSSPTGETVDHLSALDVWGRFMIHPRLQLWATLPFHAHFRNETQQVSEAVGAGDLQLQTLYSLLRPSDSLSSKPKHYVLAGLGLTLPTGGYQHRNRNQLLFPMAFQPGKGSWQFQVQATHIAELNNWGIQQEMRFRFALPNELNNRPGSYLHYALGSYFRISTSKALWIFSGGLMAEYFGAERENGYALNGGDSVVGSGNLGIDLFISPFYLTLSMRSPFINSLSTSPVPTGPGVGLGFGFFF
jgi:hypothetical protein